MAVEAIYMGQSKDGAYWVNVRNAEPKGMIGDAGVIRRFETKQEAKEYAKKVNETGVDTFEYKKDVSEEKPVRHQGDTFELSSK